MISEEQKEKQKEINRKVTNQELGMEHYVSPSGFSPRHNKNNGEYTKSQRFWDWVADMHG